MDLIVLSKNFPRNYSSHLGIFVEEQVRALQQKVKGKITVIVPIPWSPRILWFKSQWKEYGKAEKKVIKHGIEIYYPRYLVIPIRYFFPLQGVFIYLSVRAIVRRLLKKSSSDFVLHSHTILPDGLAGVLLCKSFNIPHVCTAHGSDVNIYPSMSRLAAVFTKHVLQRSDRIVTVSERLREKIQSLSSVAAPISVIYNGADPARFKCLSKTDARATLQISLQARVIVFIGNLIPVKGVRYLLEAFAELHSNGGKDDCLLYLVGDGSERENLRKIAQSLEIGGKVVFAGQRNHSEIPLWLNAADLLVLPSISEGFPTIIPEAMMCGVPVIASDVGGIREIIIHGKTGFLTKPGDKSDLTRGMEILLSDRGIRSQIIADAREQVGRFTWEHNSRESMKVYQTLLGGS